MTCGLCGVVNRKHGVVSEAHCGLHCNFLECLHLVVCCFIRIMHNSLVAVPVISAFVVVCITVTETLDLYPTRYTLH